MDFIRTGKLLIAEPNLSDKCFFRTVVLLIMIDKQGVVGLILNKPKKNFFLPFLGFDIRPQLYLGGPIEPESLLFLHKKPNLISGSVQIENTQIYQGGDLGDVQKGFQNKTLKMEDIMFYAGYSGWGIDQLYSELYMKNWMVADFPKDIQIFDFDVENLWKNSLHDLGWEYSSLGNIPRDISMN